LTLSTALGYNNLVVKSCNSTVLVLRRSDVEVLLRNLASVYSYKKADSDSNNCNLYCLVLESCRVFSFLSNRSVLSGFFMRTNRPKALY